MKAIILFSGGLDSTVMLAMAMTQGRECHALSFDYGQRHRIELASAKAIAAHYCIPHTIIKIDSQAFGRSALVEDLFIAKNRDTKTIAAAGIPTTYVPARNTLFLAYATGQAELLQAGEIYFGCNALDERPYPDCRPSFVAAFQQVLNNATQQAVEGHPPKLITPLIHLNKVEIIHEGLRLNAPLDLTWSCYDPEINGKPCGACDACMLRKEGFSKVAAALQKI